LYACLESGIAVSGHNRIMSNGTVAPGKVWPSPPVPIDGSTAFHASFAACAFDSALMASDAS